MKRVIEVEMETRCKNVKTALNRLFKKYPALDYWREVFEYIWLKTIKIFSVITQ